MRNLSKIQRAAALGSVLKDYRVFATGLRGGTRSFSPVRLQSRYEELEFIHGKDKMRLAANLAKQTPRDITHWLQFSEVEIRDMLVCASGLSDSDREALVATARTPKNPEVDSRHPSSE